MATHQPTPHPRLSHLFRDPIVRAAFERAERDGDAGLVEPDAPKPVLSGGSARALELA